MLPSSSKHWKKVATNRMNKITKLREQLNELKDNLAQVMKEMGIRREGSGGEDNREDILL